MARIRTVKPEFFTHPEIVRLSIPGRLLFISLLTQADDEGRLYDQPTRIRGEAFGESDRVKILQLLEELAGEDRIHRYEAEGRRCIQIQKFSEHQRVSHPTPSRIPPEPGPNGSGPRPESFVPDLGTGNREQGTGKGSPADEPPAEAFGSEAEDLCELLADLIEANGSKRPVISHTWLIEADRLFRIDKRDEEEARVVLRFSQDDSFWRSNILSMPKFRVKYDQLRLKMRDTGTRKTSSADRILLGAKGGESNGQAAGHDRGELPSRSVSAT